MAMITTDTILSMFDEKGTILKWLKKLESTLATSTLESVETRRQGDNVYFDFIFADGTTITSDAVEVHNGIDGQDGQDGEDGQDGQDGENGLDALSLSSAVNTNPVTGGTFDVANLLFNRNPVYGDNVICIDNYQNNTYILVCTVNEVTSSAVTLQIQNAYQLNAEGGGSGGTKFYKHEIVSSRSGTRTLTAYSFDGTAFTTANAGNLSKYVYKASYSGSPALIEFGNLGGDVVYISNVGSTTPIFADMSLYTPNPSDTLTDTVTEL